MGNAGCQGQHFPSSAEALAPAAVAACLAVAPVLLAEAPAAGEMVAREPVRPARD
jgi:hypothetical protein